MSANSKRLVAGWFLVLAGAVAALLVAWLGHIVHVSLATALTAAVIVIALSWLIVLTTVLLSGKTAGYYIAGIALLSTAFRPAAAYFGHLRERIKVLTRESTHPRDDVVTLLHRTELMEQSADELRLHLRDAHADLRRT